MESHPLCRLKKPTVISIWLLVGFHPATWSVQSTPADNPRKRVWQYIEKEKESQYHKVLVLIPVKAYRQSSDFIWPFLRPYMGVIPNPKMAFIFPISCILALILIKYFPKCVGKGSFPKSQIKSLQSCIIISGFQIRVCIGKLFSFFSSKAYVVGTQKTPLNEMVLLSTQNTFK